MSPNMLPNNKKITIANTNTILYMLDPVLKAFCLFNLQNIPRSWVQWDLPVASATQRTRIGRR